MWSVHFWGSIFCQVSPTDFGSAAASSGSGRTAEAEYQTEAESGELFLDRQPRFSVLQLELFPWHFSKVWTFYLHHGGQVFILTALLWPLSASMWEGGWGRSWWAGSWSVTSVPPLSYPESLPQPQYLSGHNVTAHEPNLLPPSLHAAFFAPFITCKGFLSPFPNLYNFYNNHSLQPVNTLLFVADWPGDNLDNYCGDHVIDSTALGWWVGDGIYFTAGKLSARMLPWGMKGISAAEFHGIYVFL